MWAVPALADGASDDAAGEADAATSQLVMFESPGCAWCAAWNRDIGVLYHKTDEGKRLPLRRVDISEDRPDDLEHLKGVMYTPTFVVMHNGKEVGRITGYPGSEFFWPLLGDLITRMDQMPPSGS
ncbi:MAG: hypothetical protein KDE22_01760 [Rhodobacterales bacterium]|nr:hypothetical protein [Rhodobacterales bacterium]